MMDNTRRRLLAMVGGLALMPLAAPAQKLGTIGPTYGIAEPHLLRWIEARLRDKEASGELQRLARAAQARAVEAVRRPAPVEGLKPTQVARSYEIDPSFTIDRPIADASGQLMFAAGTRRNPLEVVSLSRQLLFFDARDPRQVRHAQALLSRPGPPIKPILTGGSYLDLMAAWRVPVYFDQQGSLVRRLGIRQVPAIVSQQGLKLRVDEVVVP